MCGVFFTNSINNYESKEISPSLIRRGPDKVIILNKSDYLVQFARLSIRNIIGGDQPYLNRENSHIAAINGELYNEKFVKNRLNLDATSIPSGDMQVLAEFLIQDIDNLRYVEGMFAGFIYNKIMKHIVLFRDPVGEKPLYYLIENGTVTVSSTIRAIIEHFDSTNFRLNAKTLFKGHNSPGETIFSEIQEVLPGHYLEFNLASHEVKNVKYHQRPTRSINRNTDYDIKVQFDENLLRVVEATSISEVPICMLLSGGLDSAAILSALNTIQSNTIPAFTLKFENQAYDESELAQLSAKSLGSEHTIISISNKEFASEISKILDSLDSPILDPAYLPMYFLANKIRNNYGFKVAMTGDGGDELFRGYELYKIMKRINFANRFPVNIPSIALVNIFKILNLGSNRRNSLNFLLNRLNTILEHRDIPWHEAALSPFAGTALFSLLAPPRIKSSIIMPRQIKQADIENYYHDEILPQVYLKKSDNGSMSNGLEIRAPFLHKSMLDFAYTISEKKIESKPHKWLLKEYLNNKVPNEILSQPKRGFSVPLSGIISNISKPIWTLEKINLSSYLCDSVWDKGCKGDANAARASYAIMILNSYIQKYV